MKFHLAKKDGYHNYIPAFDEDLLASCTIKVGDIVEVKVVDARIVKRHNKLMKLFDIGYSNQERFKNKSKYRDYILTKIGWCITFIDESGKLFFNAKKIDFESLSEESIFLKEVYNPCVEEIAKQLHIKNEELAIQVLNNF